MNEEQQKVNQVAKGMGVILSKNSDSFIRMAIKPGVKKILTKAEFQTWISSNYFAGVSLWDERYHFVDISFWRAFTDIFWGKYEPYLSDVHDCDNYAFYFSSMASHILKINTGGVSSGSVYKPDGTFIDRHAFNGIIALDNGELKAYIFEPMKNLMTDWKGQKTELGGWKYEVGWSEFF
jgi:hypothetical protein